jgi:hypothetical protein
MLGVTCDNASPNDVMIDILEEDIDAFDGAENRARCFNHIINLTARKLTSFFDAPKNKKKGGGSEEINSLDQQGMIDMEKELAELEKDFEDEEERTRLELDREDADDNENGADEVREMSEEAFQSAMPVRLVLAKVSVLLNIDKEFVTYQMR